MTSPYQCPNCGNTLASETAEGLCPQCLMAAALGSDVSPSVQPEFAPTHQSRPGFTPPSVESLARLFPHLEIIETLGHGGMGAVYKARQTKLDRLVALKIIRPGTADDPAFAERFNREARTLAKLNHPHIVGVYDFGDVDYVDDHGHYHGPLYYFLMEYVDGANLRQIISSGATTPQQALAIVPQICDALQYAHLNGVVHRDIKPDNILLDSTGLVKIADFGLAKLGSESDFGLTATHQVLGTVRYMAPEQMAGSSEVDHRADIYSLGVVLYEMLTGEVPVGAFEPPSRRASVDARLDEVVMRAMASDPDRRYQSISEISNDMSGIDFGTGVPPADAVDAWPGPSTIIEKGVGALAAGVREMWNPDEESDEDGGRRTVTVSRELAESDDLPDICMVCGTVTKRKSEQNFEHTPDSYGVLIVILMVVFFPAGIVVAVMSTKKSRVQAPVCFKHRNHWLKLVLFASIAWLLIPATLFPGLAICGVFSDGATTAPRIVAGVLTAVSGVVLYVGPLIYLCCTRIGVDGITERDITFTRVHAAFARAARRIDAMRA